MRNMNDLKNAFGEADTAFHNNVYRTLRELQASKEKAHMKKINMRFIAAVVTISTLMIATTALALSNAWGILDFLTGRQNVAKCGHFAGSGESDYKRKPAARHFA